MRSARIASILRSIRELAEPVHVSGATAAARALMVARWVAEVSKPTVIICPNDDAAAQFLDDLECLAPLIPGAKLTGVLFPTWDQSPYSTIAPSLKTRLARLAALGALLDADGAAGRVLVTSIPAIAQATLTPEHFRGASSTIAKGQSVGSREALMSRLAEAGYLRVDPVEDKGTFAVRGDIIDVFPADREHPLRIELFGDEIELIREFDVATQRTTASAELTQVRLIPARETLINQATTGGLRERLKQRADDQGIPRPVRDPILASVYPGTYPDHSDAWAPFAYEKPATLLDYLAGIGHAILWDDELSCQQSWDDFIEEQKRRADEAPNSSLILPPAAELYRWTAEADRELRARSTLFMDRLEMAGLSEVGEEPPEPAQAPEEEPVSTKLKVFVRGNGDLIQGSKHSLGDLEPKLKQWTQQRFAIVAIASTQSQLERIRYLLEERKLSCVPRENYLAEPPQPGIISLLGGSLSEGFRWPAEGLVVLTESEILGSRHVRKQARARKKEDASAAKDWAGLQALSDLAVGDAVVHVDHGIGRYQGLVRLSLSGAPSDFLQLEYANKDKLYLPIYRLNVIQKYVGAGEAVQLDKLGTQQFAKAKEKVKDAVKRLAIDLVQLYAKRKIQPGVVFSPRGPEFREFEANFPFDETPDQLKAIEDTQIDLESGRVMDRLVCGDVGYGKTEVAIRAAFRAVNDGKQVAVLVPTTILAHQHEQSFKARLKDYALNIESISRFKTAKEQKRILENLAQGKLDIVVGTHRLLSRDVKFHDLGLVIVDEEHRFGVEHKEKLKTFKTNTHVLTLTATPIPRTLHMALSGLRDITLINTPPVDRLPIRTYVSKYDDELVKRAIEFELNRGGQVFFLHNRVQSIHEIGRRAQELVPKAKVVVAHGQMAESELEAKIVEFYEKRANVLVCTAIIESGIDLPSANTILINRADALGLAQLYQIRGRVGRGQSRAYAYLMIPAEGAITDEAKRRLEVIQRFVELGSGFQIASHDLELRGGGDLLGPQQSGHIAAVGFDLYTELLEEAIHELEGKPLSADETRGRREPEIKSPFAAFLSEEYVPDVHQRLSLYRRFSASTQDAEVDGLEAELQDRFGPLPFEAQNLMWLIRVKMLLKRLGVDALTVGPEKVSLVSGHDTRIDPTRVIALLSSQPSVYQLTPDSKLVVKLPTGTLRDLYFALEALSKRLVASSHARDGELPSA